MCLCPVPIKYTDMFGVLQSISVDCGKCLECLIRQQNDWKCRIIEQSKDFTYMYFFTLTYREDDLPYYVKTLDENSLLLCRGRDLRDVDESCKVSTCLKSDIQDWFKRWRTREYRSVARSFGITLKELKQCRYYQRFRPSLTYYVTSEYGPNGTHRPHYHGCLFTECSPSQIMHLFADWRKNFGYVQWSRVKLHTGETNKGSKCANYVSKYSTKNQFYEVIDEFIDDEDTFRNRLESIKNGDCEKCFRLVSKSFGSGFLDRFRKSFKSRECFKTLEEYANYCIDNSRYHDGSCSYRLPRYFKTKLFYGKKKSFREKFDKKQGKWIVQEYTRLANITPLSLEMSRLLRNRADESYRERFELLKSTYQFESDAEIHLFIATDTENSLRSREKIYRHKLRKFYESNKLKNKAL